MFCRMCGNKLSDTATFCHSCGTQVTPELSSYVIKNYCTTCGKNILSVDGICTTCGLPSNSFNVNKPIEIINEIKQGIPIRDNFIPKTTIKDVKPPVTTSIEKSSNSFNNNTTSSKNKIFILIAIIVFIYFIFVCAGLNFFNNPSTTETTVSTTSIFHSSSSIYSSSPSTINIINKGQVVYLHFTPVLTKTYTISSTGSYDTYLEYYGSNRIYDSFSDDNNADKNFNKSINLTAGTTYYFAVSMYSYNDLGTFTVTIQ